MNTIDKLSIDTIRVLSAEAIQKANSGHPGMPIGAAPIAYAIWKNMNHNPKDPSWRGRARFILSAGHASMLEYSLLHLYGYDVSMDDIKQFRQLGQRHLLPGGKPVAVGTEQPADDERDDVTVFRRAAGDMQVAHDLALHDDLDILGQKRVVRRREDIAEQVGM